MADNEYQQFLEERFEPVGDVVFRRMFGGLGIFRHGLMFALVAGEDGLCFKADEETIPRFEAVGCGPWLYEGKGGKPVEMGYWHAPERLFDEPDEFREWALAAFEVAVRADAKKPPSQRKLKT